MPNTLERLMTVRWECKELLDSIKDIVEQIVKLRLEEKALEAEWSNEIQKEMGEL